MEMINTISTLDIQAIREQFPALHQEVYGQPLVYLDNAATSQKPLMVIEAIDHYYRKQNSNIHRGVHHLSQVATDAYEQAREKIRAHMNVEHAHEIIFTRGTTEAINLVASSFGRMALKAGDEVIISAIEHHSNIVPWQLICEQQGAILKVIPSDLKGVLDMEAYKALLSDRTKLVSVNHISNALGTINPVKEIIALAHSFDAKVMIDGAQAAPHMKIDVQDLDADFYCFSGHKAYGPTGSGVLYGKEDLLNAMPPYHGGGEMIKEVSFEGSTWADLPHKFEAGTPNIASGIALGYAIDFMNQLGLDNIAAHEHMLLTYATEQLSKIDGMRFIGEAEEKAGALSFLIDGIHPYDTGMILDKMGIAIRTGHHCAQPIMKFFKIQGTARASFAVYNTTEEIDRLVVGLNKVKQLFG
ncbi:MAG: cysteine desulfurase/selenocysteine lyase [Flavobacteriales bacterium]|jgi:cysteine desulfurase/selenocysteine lyase